MSFHTGEFAIYATSVDLWCERHDLEVFEAPCHQCGSILEVSIPFATKHTRGLKAKQCRCGNEETPFSYVELENGISPNLNWLCKSVESSRY